MDKDSSDTNKDEGGEQEAAPSRRQPKYDLGTNRLLAEQARLGRLVEPVTASLRESGLALLSQYRDVMEQALGPLRNLDRLTPNPFKGLELSATANLSRALTGSSLLSVERTARLADFNLGKLKAVGELAKPRYFDQLFDTSKFITSISESLLSTHRAYAPIGPEGEYAYFTCAAPVVAEARSSLEPTYR